MSTEEQSHIVDTEDAQQVDVEEYTEEEKQLGQAFIQAILDGDLVSLIGFSALQATPAPVLSR